MHKRNYGYFSSVYLYKYDKIKCVTVIDIKHVLRHSCFH